MSCPSRVTAAALLLGFGLMAGAAAQTTLPPRDPRAVIHLLTENDSYTLTNPRTDRFYTAGNRIGFTTAEGVLPGPLAWLDGGLASVFGPAQSRWGLSIGQQIFTPRNTDAVEANPRDRPYAGYLFGTLSLDRRGWNTLDRYELQVGVTGPISQGKDAQNLVHEILGDREARGWGRQLRSEGIANLNAERIWRVAIAQPLPGVGVDVLPSLGAMAGLARVSATAGARVRLGRGLDRDFGPPRLRPAIADTPAPLGEGFGWYVFGGAAGNAVAHDLFIEGNTFTRSRGVELRPFVADFEAGGSVFWNNVRLSYTQVWRTEEFVAQRSYHSFGAFSLSFAF